MQITYSPTLSIYKTRRDEILSTYLPDLNELREKAGYKPMSKKLLAIKCNQNPFLKDDGELENLLKECQNKRSYSKLFWVLPRKV